MNQTYFYESANALVFPIIDFGKMTTTEAQQYFSAFESFFDNAVELSNALNTSVANITEQANICLVLVRTKRRLEEVYTNASLNSKILKLNAKTDESFAVPQYIAEYIAEKSHKYAMDINELVMVIKKIITPRGF